MKLTDKELGWLTRLFEADMFEIDQAERLAPIALRAFAELRDRRALDLSDEERNDLAYARVATSNEYMRNGAPALLRAVAILDRLLERK